MLKFSWILVSGRLFDGRARRGRSRAPRTTTIRPATSNAPRPGATEGALMLLGGGDWPVPAFRWFVEKMGHGHLRDPARLGRRRPAAGFSQGDRRRGRRSRRWCSIRVPRPAIRACCDILRRADGIFFGGGDQSNYVRYFKGTPLNELLDEHVRAGKPIGGTSAGLAILGAYSYGAMDGGSLLSADAMKNPLGSGVTLVRDFLHLPYLSHVITDSPFRDPRALGAPAGVRRPARE